MTYQSNKWLEKYEIKGPDYDYLNRAVILDENQAMKPKRFVRTNDRWDSISSPEASRGLFGIKQSSNTARVMFTGDITCFERALDAAKTEDGYDFNYVFSEVKSIFAQSDLTVGNLETMIVPEAPYRTEKFISEQTFHCNAPIEFLDALKESGIDMVTNANNHDLDTGAVGIGETIDFLEHYGLIQTGTFKTKKPRFEMFRIKGINIAVTSFAIYHNYHEDNLTQEGKDFLISTYDRNLAEKTLKEARDAGADVVIACVHWWLEYMTEHIEQEETVATEMAELGYDAIIGSHPHVLQDFDIIKAGSRNVPVFYSMGNFVTHHVDNPRARTVIACLDISKKKDRVSIDCSYIPVCVSSAYGDKNYIIVPLKHDSKYKKNRDAANYISEVLGDKVHPDKQASYPDLKQRDKEDAVKEIPKREKQKLKLKGNTEWPVTYDAGKFIYDIYEDHAEVVGISEGINAASLTISNNIRKRPITGMAEGVFQGKGMKRIEYGNNMEYVSDFALKDCTNLEGVFQLTGTLQWIGESAFENCTNLTCIVLYDNVKTVKKNAYKGCTGLRSAKIADGVEFIADDAFEGCDQVIFYCSKDSYAHKYAEEHGIKTVDMEVMDL